MTFFNHLRLFIRATCLFVECQIISKGLFCTHQLCCLDIRSTSIILNNVSSDITKQNKIISINNRTGRTSRIWPSLTDVIWRENESNPQSAYINTCHVSIASKSSSNKSRFKQMINKRHLPYMSKTTSGSSWWTGYLYDDRLEPLARFKFPLLSNKLNCNMRTDNTMRDDIGY